MNREEMNRRYDKFCKLEINEDGDEVMYCPPIARLPDDLFEAIFKMDMCPAAKLVNGFVMEVCCGCEWNTGLNNEMGKYIAPTKRCKILNLHEQFKRDGMLLEEDNEDKEN